MNASVAVRIQEFDAAVAALAHKYRADLRPPPWDAQYTAWARTRISHLLNHLSGWRPVADEDEATLALRDRAIDAACRLWLAVTEVAS